MEKKKRLVFPAHVCAMVIMIILLSLYPLYMNHNGYLEIDSAKYNFIWAIGRFGLLAMTIAAIVQSLLYPIPKQVRSRLSIIDICVLLYSVSISFSIIFSENRHSAIYGITGWYLGGALILIFCAFYFFISRFWRDDRIVLKAMLIASALVFSLGVLNRFSIWPFVIPGYYKNYEFISTLGNIGWYNGYLSVVATIGISLYVLLPEKNIIKRILLGVYTWIVFMTALSQGGDTIFIYFFVLFGGLLLICTFYRNGLKRWLEVIMIWSISGQILHYLRHINLRWYNYKSDNLINLFNNKYTTLWVFIPTAIIYLLLWKKDIPEWINKWVRRLIVLVVVAMVVWLITACIYTNSPLAEAPEAITEGEASFKLLLSHSLYLNKNWGGGRGVTIDAGIRLFRDMPWYRKLIGVGPNCFSVAAYQNYEIANSIREVFGDSILVNAHCEPVTSLCELGITGTVLYYAVWISFLIRCKKLWRCDIRVLSIALAIVCYLFYNSLNYTTILNYPFAFLMLAIGETWFKHIELAGEPK